MAVRNAEAVWNGGLQDGSGSFSVESGAIAGSYSAGTRFEDEPGTNPEELIGAAHAACFSMALSAGLGKAGYEPASVKTTAAVSIERGDAGFSITQIELATAAEVPGIGEEEFAEIAEATKTGCPVSKALASVPMTLNAVLLT